MAYSSILGMNSPEHQEAEMLAGMGRGGDTEMAHVTPGEIMIPPQVWEANPKLQESIKKAFLAHGVDPKEFMAGSPLQKINPVTGQPEFGFFSKIFKTIKKVALPVAAFVLSGGNPLVTAAAAGAGSAIRGGDLGQILTSAGYGLTGAGIANAGLAGLSAAQSAASSAGTGILSGGTTSGGIAWDAPLLTGAKAAAGNIAASLSPTTGTGFASAALKAAPMLAGLMSSPNPAPAEAAVPGTSVQTPSAAIPNPTLTSVPTNVPQAAATVPKGAGTPPSGIGLASIAPAGVSFLQPLKNRDTGQTGYTEAPFSTALSNIRRGSFGGAIFA